MIKKISLTILFLFCIFYSYSQQWLGMVNSNYSGVNSLYLNPAYIADSRYKFHFNLVSAGANFDNDYMRFGAPFSFFQVLTNNYPDQYKTDPSASGFGNLNVSDADLLSWTKENLDGQKKSLNLGLQFRLPSVMFNYKKVGFALTNRQRIFVQGSNISETLLRLMWGYNADSRIFDGSNSLTLDQAYTDNSINLNMNFIQEHGLSLAIPIYNKNQHYLKAGITGKLLLGQGSIFIRNNGLNFSIPNYDSLVLLSGDVEIGMATPLDYNEFINGNQSPGFTNPLSRLSKGFGADLGVVYEWRPDHKKYKYMLDGKEREDETVNKYKLRLGASVIDIGGITYNKPNQVLTRRIRFNSPVSISNADSTYSDRIENSNDKLATIDSVLTEKFGGLDRGNSFRTTLPTALNITVDYHIWKKLYVNLTWIQSLRKPEKLGMRQFSAIAITPRFESRFFEFAVPLSLQQGYKTFNSGLYTRVGPVFLGTDNIGGLFTKRNVTGFDFYFGLVFSLRNKNPKDSDKDGVSNAKDLCDKVPGPWELLGCPDADGDLIPDKDDECPEIPGKLAFKGCPDSDNDSIPDKIDACPTEFGLASLNGCPDNDLDGIANMNDSCPDLAGPIELFGCPDSDNDGIIDPKDDCPNVKGLPQFNGCPDTDMDGIQDSKDKCPLVAGLQEFNGCPDTDGDGIPDNIDLCPLEKGIKENNGCPKVEKAIEIIEITEEEEKILNEVFNNLEFETAKSTIKQESILSLEELAELLLAKPEYRIYIAGHTDNVGNKKSNQKLSKDRAEAVKNFLVSKGIDASRIETEGFGDQRPIDTNKTPEGRQKNRRVEFRIIK